MVFFSFRSECGDRSECVSVRNILVCGTQEALLFFVASIGDHSEHMSVRKGTFCGVVGTILGYSRCIYLQGTIAREIRCALFCCVHPWWSWGQGHNCGLFVRRGFRLEETESARAFIVDSWFYCGFERARTFYCVLVLLLWSRERV